MKFYFEKSAVFPEHYPEKSMPEVAIAGRSNSGKSSLINSWAQSRLAKISSQPGKTRLLNFFVVEERFRLVDMPGYGYAARGSKERQSWEQMIETYMTEREDLRGLLLIMDIRRKWTADEAELVEWCNRKGLQVFVILNKQDKATQKIKHAAIKDIESHGLKPFVVSSKTKRGVEELIQAVWNTFVKPDKEEFSVEDL